MNAGRRALPACYAATAAVGLVGTWWFNLRSAAVAGGYLRGWFANAASSSAAVDLIVVFLGSAVFMVVEGRRCGMRLPWLYPLLALPTALAFTLPLFLLARERRLRREQPGDAATRSPPAVVRGRSEGGVGH